MIWLYGGLAYMAVYAFATWLLRDAPAARLWVGNIGLLLPPLAPLAVVLVRRRGWFGHQRVFWDALAAAAAIWLAAQIPLAIYELRSAATVPWLNLTVVPQLTASLMPLLALTARPDRGQRAETALTAVVDVYVLAILASFMYWSLLMLPGMAPARSGMAVRMLTVIGPSVRVAVFVGLGIAAWTVARGDWAGAYRRIGTGALVSFVVLALLGLLVDQGTYRTGSPLDVGWMAPFWFWAWAAAAMPASPPDPQRSLVNANRPAPPALLFLALCAVAATGFGGRYLMPLPADLERYRELVTGVTLFFGLLMVMVRSRVERGALRYADRQIRLLAAACEQSDELIVIIRKGAIRYANPAFVKVTGYTPGEIRSLAPEALEPAGSREILSRLDQAESGRTMTRVTTQVSRKDGTAFQADCTIAPIVEPFQAGVHVVCVMRDLTEDLRVQDQLVRFERMSAIGELLSGVALELSSPLQSVVGSLELARQADATAALREDLDRASREADRAVRLVKNLLAFVKRSPSERLLIEFSEIVQSAVAARLPSLRASHIEVSESFAPGLPLVQVNGDEMRQAIINLFVNAEQAMATEGGGVLTLRTYLDGNDAVLDVCDDGPGVPAEAMGRIFEPFFAVRKVGEGQGLGLSAAFGIVTAHGGSLELVTGAGPGACFRLKLPGAGFPGPAMVKAALT